MTLDLARRDVDWIAVDWLRERGRYAFGDHISDVSAFARRRQTIERQEAKWLVSSQPKGDSP